MHRATQLNIGLRSYTSGGSRSVVGSADDTTLMQEMQGNIMSGESRQKIESPQNFGFTSVVMDADKGSDGTISKGAETFLSYMGGGRHFPVATVMDDRRHRLQKLQKGDSAMFSTVGRKLQLHHNTDGGFWTGPRDKTLRMQLLDEDSTSDQQQQGGSGSGGGGSSPGTRDGSTGGTGSTGGQGGQQQYGQQARYKDAQNSYRFVDVTKDTTRISGNESHMMLSDGDSYVHCLNQKTYLGGNATKHQFALVCTEAGPAYNVYARISPSQYALLHADPVVGPALPSDEDDPTPRDGCPPGCYPPCGSGFSKSAKFLAGLTLLLGVSLGANYALVRDALTKAQVMTIPAFASR